MNTQGSTVDAAIYRLCGDGSPPPMLKTRATNKTFSGIVLQSVKALLCDDEDGGQATGFDTYMCPHCNELHNRCVVPDTARPPQVREASPNG